MKMSFWQFIGITIILSMIINGTFYIVHGKNIIELLKEDK